MITEKGLNRIKELEEFKKKYGLNKRECWELKKFNKMLEAKK